MLKRLIIFIIIELYVSDTLSSFEALNEGGFFTADVGSSSSVKVQIVVIACWKEMTECFAFKSKKYSAMVEYSLPIFTFGIGT